MSFAINLAIPAAKVLETRQSVNVTAEPEALKTSGGYGDEADSGRTKVSASCNDSSLIIIHMVSLPPIPFSG